MEVTEDVKNMDLLISCRNVLKYHFMWPKRVTKVYLLQWFFFTLTLYIITMGLWGHMIHFLSDNPVSYPDLAHDMAGITSSHTALYIHILHLTMKDKTDKLLDDLGDFREVEKPQGIERANKLLNLSARGFIIFFYCSWTLIWIYKMSEDCPPNDESDCGFLINAYIAYVDIFNTPGRQIFMSLQMYSGFWTAIIAFHVSWLSLAIVTIVVIYIRHFKNMLAIIPTIKEIEIRRAHVKKCIKYHQRIIYLGEIAENSAGGVMLVHITMTAIIVSMITYQMFAMKFELIMLIHVLCYLFSSYIAAFFGEMLFEESTTITESAFYSIPWDGDIQTAKDLMMIMQAKPLYLPTGKFGYISHARFLLILKTTYSYLALLLNTK